MPPCPRPRPIQLALRAGNEKEEGESADTVGCCSLRVEHVQLHPEADGCPYVVEFDFLGKDSIRYYNKVPVEKPVSACVGGGGSRPSDARPPRPPPTRGPSDARPLAFPVRARITRSGGGTRAQEGPVG